MRAEKPALAVLVRLVPEREAASVPPGRLPNDCRRCRSPLAHLLKFPLGELHQVGSEPLPHPRGHVDVLGDADNRLAVDGAELVVEEQEVQVVPETPVELVEDKDIPLVKVIGRQPRADPWTLLDRLTARDVQVLGLGHDEDVLPLAVLLDGLRLRVEVRRDMPHPKWLVTELAAVDTELGILKTGKEADVYLIRRGLPGTERSCLLAAKRYRDTQHRLFHRDAGYLEGRRTRDSRVSRATANRTAFGREAIAGQWANAEFAALCRLHRARVPVPYPVQIVGTEVLLEFIGDPDGTGAPRLAETRPGKKELARLWEQLVDALCTLARHGLAHGDLSAYNLLVHRGKLVMIDLPQVVDVIAHPDGQSFLTRDARNAATWFAARGLQAADPDKLARLLHEEARLE